MSKYHIMTIFFAIRLNRDMLFASKYQFRITNLCENKLSNSERNEENGMLYGADAGSVQRLC